MVATADAVACANCGAELHGPYCSACGQKDTPPSQTLWQMAADGWREITHYDSASLRTLSLLVRRPGALTADILAGRRARYLSPLRLYLMASVFFFLALAAGPRFETEKPTPVVSGGKINVTLTAQDTSITEEERARTLAKLETVAPWQRAVLRPIVLDPEGFKRRFTAALPRALFAIVPILAVLVALFFPGRPFPQHFTFALNLQAWIFLALGAGQFALFIRNEALPNALAVVLAAYIGAYSVLAFRRVYGAGWTAAAIKAACIAALYVAAYMATLYATLAWTALV